MMGTTFEIALGDNKLEGFLKSHCQLMQNHDWGIEERLWIFLLDRDGFLVSKLKFFPEFLKELFYQGIGFVSLKGAGGYYYLVLKAFLKARPEIKYTSQLRSDLV